jgi:hypothetical protein
MEVKGSERRKNYVTAFGEAKYVPEENKVSFEGNKFTTTQPNGDNHSGDELLVFVDDAGKFHWMNFNHSVLIALGFVSLDDAVFCAVLNDKARTVVQLKLENKEKWPEPSDVIALTRCLWLRVGNDEGKNPYYLLQPVDINYVEYVASKNKSDKPVRHMSAKRYAAFAAVKTKM